MSTTWSFCSDKNIQHDDHSCISTINWQQNAHVICKASIGSNAYLFIAGICELIENNDFAMNDRKTPVSMSIHLICLHSSWNLTFNESLMPSNIAKATRETNMEVFDVENRRQTDKRDLVQICLWGSMYSKSLREYE